RHRGTSPLPYTTLFRSRDAGPKRSRRATGRPRRYARPCRRSTPSSSPRWPRRRRQDRPGAVDGRNTPMTQDHHDRLDRARTAAGEAGIDALLITPGAALRYLTGYDALPLERLTCLIVPSHGPVSLVVPALEEPAARASVPEGLTVTAWPETDDPVDVVAAQLRGVRRVGLDDEMWAEKVLRFRAAMPAAEQTLAGPVLSRLRVRKSGAEIDALRAAGAAIDRV